MKNPFNKIILFIHILRNMGVGYVAFRIWYMFLKQTGLMKVKFPAKSRKIKTITNAKHNETGNDVLIPSAKVSENMQMSNIMNMWGLVNESSFFRTREVLRVPGNKNDALREAGEKILKGELFFFNNHWIWLGKNYDWVTNPKTGYDYNISQHWSEINELDPNAGDIKYVWEKSRFTYLLTVIRYDHHYEVDCSKFVFDEILSWIEHNPVNCGPNWICSQEMSLRLMNWFFALFYYKNHSSLTQNTIETILQSIYDQILHIYSNIQFSLKTVRNNHALSESLLLYLAGHLFPFFQEAGNWRTKGKIWFEKEIDHQIYQDGSYIQYSMNYHRVVIQLLTLAIFYSEKVDDAFHQKVYEKAQLSLDFLIQLHNEDLGYLPNYGNNDGALIFPFNNQKFYDFRPQLNALHFALHKKHLFEGIEIQEEAFWFGADSSLTEPAFRINSINKFDTGGYYSFRDEESFTFIRCGKHINRPGQADNLHLSVDLNGKSLLRDSGTYQYNGDLNDVNYFFGTNSHNTIILGNADQMKKSGRFIWLYWSQSEHAELVEDEDWIIFKGRISAFRHIGKDIQHIRTVRKRKKTLQWEIEDQIIKKPDDLNMVQIWHPNPELIDQIKFTAYDLDNDSITPDICEGLYAPGYGSKTTVPEVRFATEGSYLRTIISVH